MLPRLQAHIGALAVELSGLSPPLLLKHRVLPVSEAAFILFVGKHRMTYINLSATSLFSASCCTTSVAWLFLISGWSTHIHNNSHIFGEQWKISLLSIFFLLYSPTLETNLPRGVTAGVTPLSFCKISANHNCLANLHDKCVGLCY